MSADTSARPRGRGGRRLGALALALVPLLAGACDWFTDFKDQPKLEPWEPVAGDTVPFRGNPQGSVPVYGNRVPVWAISYAALPATIDSFSNLDNPIEADERSIAEGHKYYAINCAVCHGYDGAGSKVPLIQKYGLAISLLTPTTVARTDGYIWGMIRNGRGLMPTYNRIEEYERWDVVNYVRGLQGRLGRPVPVGPLAEPGVGGPAAVPNYTRSAPTRPAPHFSFTPVPGADLSLPGPTRPAAGPSGVPTPDTVLTPPAQNPRPGATP